MKVRDKNDEQPMDIEALLRLVQDQQVALSERDQTLASRDQTLASRDQTLASRDQTLASRIKPSLAGSNPR